MLRKILAVSAVAFLMVCLPMSLAAQEGAVRAAEEAALAEWFSSIWSWLANQLIPASVDVDGSCSLDPDGCPRGAVAPPEPSLDSFGDGRCSLDPNGCPGGA
jgi:hypothetical protein